MYMGCRCEASHQLDHSWGIVTCRMCGVSRPAPIRMTVPFGYGLQHRQPYSRKRRFQRLLSNVTGQRCSHVPGILFQALQAAGAKSSRDIYLVIRRAKNRRMKRYDALSYLSQVVLGHDVAPLNINQTTWAIHTFTSIEIRHCRIRGTFPAYAFIVEQVCITIGRHDLLKYIHKLKCANRRAVYQKHYGDIFKSWCGNDP